MDKAEAEREAGGGRVMAAAARVLPGHVWPDAARMTVAAVVSFVLARAVHMPGGGYWCVISTLMTVRVNGGGSARAVAERLIGTGIGIGVGTLVILGRHWRVPEPALVAAAILPLALMVVRLRRYQAAPIAAIIVLSASAAAGSALHFAAMRIAEIGLGAGVGLAVSALVPRGHAARKSRLHAGLALAGLGDLMAAFAEPRREPAWRGRGARGPEAGRREPAIRQRIQSEMRLAAAHGRRVERAADAATSDRPEAALPRLVADVSLVGRAAALARREQTPAAQAGLAAFAAAFAQVSGEVAAFAGGRGAPPRLAALDAALERALDGLRGELARGLAEGTASDAMLALPFLLGRVRAGLAALSGGLAAGGAGGGIAGAGASGSGADQRSSDISEETAAMRPPQSTADSPRPMMVPFQTEPETMGAGRAGSRQAAAGAAAAPGSGAPRAMVMSVLRSRWRAGARLQAAQEPG